MLLICGRDRPIRTGELLLRDAEVREELLVGGRLFERVQLGAVQVLQQRVAQQVLVGRVADDGRNRVEAGLACRAGAALAHDQLVRAVACDRARRPAAARRIRGRCATSSARSSSSKSVSRLRGFGTIERGRCRRAGAGNLDEFAGGSSSGDVRDAAVASGKKTSTGRASVSRWSG